MAGYTSYCRVDLISAMGQLTRWNRGQKTRDALEADLGKTLLKLYCHTNTQYSMKNVIMSILIQNTLLFMYCQYTIHNTLLTILFQNMLQFQF